MFLVDTLAIDMNVFTCICKVFGNVQRIWNESQRLSLTELLVIKIFAVWMENSTFYLHYLQQCYLMYQKILKIISYQRYQCHVSVSECQIFSLNQWLFLIDLLQNYLWWFLIGVVRIADSHQNPKEDWPPCRNHPQDQALELGLIYKDVWEL